MSIIPDGKPELQPEASFDFKANVNRTILFSLNPGLGNMPVYQGTIRQISPAGYILIVKQEAIGRTGDEPLPEWVQWYDPATISVKDVLD